MSRRSNAAAAALQDPGFRSLEVRAKTFSEDTRSVDAVISTETPVLMPDYSRMEMVPEVLLSKVGNQPVQCVHMVGSCILRSVAMPPELVLPLLISSINC